MTHETQKKKSGHFQVLALYVGLFTATVFQFPLNTVLPLISFVILLVVFAAIAFIRKESDKDSHLYNHATFLSRTLWMSSFILLISVALAGIYVNETVTIGLEELQTLTQDMQEGKADSPLIRQLMPITGAAIGPGMAYFLWRYIVGFVGAVRGLSPKRPRGFF